MRLHREKILSPYNAVGIRACHFPWPSIVASFAPSLPGGKAQHHRNAHLRAAHPEEEEAIAAVTHKCGYCAKIYDTQHQLRDHVAGHENKRSFHCDQCEKT